MHEKVPVTGLSDVRGIAVARLPLGKKVVAAVLAGECGVVISILGLKRPVVQCSRRILDDRRHVAVAALDLCCQVHAGGDSALLLQDAGDVPEAVLVDHEVMPIAARGDLGGIVAALLREGTARSGARDAMGASADIVALDEDGGGVVAAVYAHGGLVVGPGLANLGPVVFPERLDICLIDGAYLLDEHVVPAAVSRARKTKKSGNQEELVEAPRGSHVRHTFMQYLGDMGRKPLSRLPVVFSGRLLIDNHSVLGT